MDCEPRSPTYTQADVGHPPPSSKERPSFASVVANVDSSTSQYAARCRVQAARQEMIEDLEGMAKVNSSSSILAVTFAILTYRQDLIEEYRTHLREKEGKTNVDPKRILYFRDGVSEGEFQQVLDIGTSCSFYIVLSNLTSVVELPSIKSEFVRRTSAIPLFAQFITPI